MILVLCLLALVMLTPYLLGPVLLRRQFRHRREAALVPLGLLDMPIDARAYIEESEATLVSLGFAHAGRVRIETVPSATAWVSVLVHRGHGDLVQIAAVAHADGETAYAVEERHVEFLAHWSGRELLTSNTSQVLPFGSTRGQSIVRFVDMDDIGLLYRIHRARVRAEPEPPRAPAPGQEIAALARSSQQFIEAQAARGNVVLRPGEDVYVLTWRGAFSATWKHLWPFRGRELSRARAAAQRLVASLEFEVPADQVSPRAVVGLSVGTRPA